MDMGLVQHYIWYVAFSKNTFALLFKLLYNDDLNTQHMPNCTDYKKDNVQIGADFSTGLLPLGCIGMSKYAESVAMQGLDTFLSRKYSYHPIYLIA